MNPRQQKRKASQTAGGFTCTCAAPAVHVHADEGATSGSPKQDAVGESAQAACS
ncbi:MAG: hypothetical protein AVDCRST_MAG89-2981 [uncultured Gemmatimonadetes bacterium]|uniref:Uncharacterized protein n=1 Tax=uncultured Gemmatimonadota bacterium TaxID=203437 RepID=A0A6J4M2I4_9BACT|nr:MAG: hypothetical protein AVDCRST_MAG89-2981 [uncultured Gemmatimonadota bacterium]